MGTRRKVWTLKDIEVSSLVCPSSWVWPPLKGLPLPSIVVHRPPLKMGRVHQGTDFTDLSYHGPPCPCYKVNLHSTSTPPPTLSSPVFSECRTYRTGRSTGSLWPVPVDEDHPYLHPPSLRVPLLSPSKSELVSNRPSGTKTTYRLYFCLYLKPKMFSRGIGLVCLSFRRKGPV